MLFSPYFAGGFGRGLIQEFLNRQRQSDILERMAAQEQLLEAQRRNMYNFYKNQIKPSVSGIVNDENVSGLLSNLFARTGNLPISPFLPKQPKIEKVREGESLVMVSPAGKAVELFGKNKKNLIYKAVKGNVAVFDENGNLLRNYEIAKTKDKGNYIISYSKPYQDKDGKWKYDVLLLDKTTGRVRRITSRKTKEPGQSKYINIGGVKYDRDLLNLAEKIVSKYFVPDEFTGEIRYNDTTLTPDEAATLKSRLIKDVYNKLLYTKQHQSPKNPGNIQPRSVLDPQFLKNLY